MHVCAECYRTRGSCCRRQPDGAPFPLLPEDMRRIAEKTGLPEEACFEGYTFTEGEIQAMRGDDVAWKGLRKDGTGAILPTRENGDCVYLDPSTGCVLGDHKPLHCAQFPFTPRFSFDGTPPRPALQPTSFCLAVERGGRSVKEVQSLLGVDKDGLDRIMREVAHKLGLSYE